ncbi:MAG: carbon storage regulator CsrA [Armatimonadota bacterium]
MLIMSRKIGETIIIGDDIEVTLVQVQLHQNQVRLGINAPRSVGVFRKELLEEITSENVRAAAAPSPDQLPNLPMMTPPETAEPPQES